MAGDLAAAARALAADFAESAEKIADKAGSWFEETGDKALQNGHDLASVDGNIAGRFGGTTGDLDGAAPPGLGPEGAPPPVEPVGGAPAGSVDPPSVNTPPSTVGTQGVGPCGKVGEPIDVVGGQMVMQALDVQLGGVLQLVLRRAYASGYRDGRLFGPGWSSPLDIRVFVGRDDVRLLDDDGRVLEYALPTRPGEMVMPAEGERLPLERDRQTDEIRVHHRRAGLTWHFTTLGAVRTHRGEDIRALTAISDRNGNRVTITRDEDGLPTAVDHSGGYRVGVETVDTPAGWRVSALRLRDPEAAGGESLLREFQYDPHGRLIAVVDATGVPLCFEHDDADRIVAWTDRVGYHFSYTYDEQGRVVATNGDGGYLSATLEYEPEHSRTFYIDSLDARTEFRYDEHGYVTATVDPLGGTVLTEYDRYGNLLSRTDELGYTTRYTLDEFGDPVRADRPDGTIIEAAYDAHGKPVRVTGPDGAAWTYAYDERGNLLTVTDPLGAQNSFTYDERGRLTSQTDALGSVTTIRTDHAGLPVAATDPLGGTWEVRRDARGRIVATIDPIGATTATVWGPEDRPASYTRPDGAVETWEYDPAGSVVRQVDPAGNASGFEIGAFGRVTARIAPDGGRYVFAYETELRLSAVTGPQGAIWSYDYDPAGNLIGETDFNGRSLAYAYDAAGRILRRVNGADEAIDLVRDALGRVVSRQASAEDVTTLAYDAAGRLTSARNATDEVVFTRDALGRIIAETANGLTLTSTYDARGWRVTRTTPNGRASAWTYDAAGRPQALTVGAEQFSFGHDAAGRETYRWFGSDTAITSEWDAAGRLTARRVLGMEGPEQQRTARMLQENAWTYRADGNPLTAADSIRGLRQLDLDPLGRVTAVRAENWTETYAYDQAGNLINSSDTRAADHATAGQRVVSGTLLRQAGRTEYEHDGQGRLVRTTRRTLSGGRKVWTFSYDAYDRLVEATLPDGARWRYQYDPLGRRTAKLRLGRDGATLERVRFTWDGSQLAEQTRTAADRPDVESVTYRPDGWAPVAQDRRTMLAEAPQDVIDREFQAIVADLVGTPAALVTSGGEIAWRSDTGLWGAPLAPAPAADGERRAAPCVSRASTTTRKPASTTTCTATTTRTRRATSPPTRSAWNPRRTTTRTCPTRCPGSTRSAWSAARRRAAGRPARSR
jgi:YD repeat-containing protein